MPDVIILPLAAAVGDSSAADGAFRPRDRDQRVAMLGSGYRVVIDERHASLVNLSLSGAQLFGPVRVLPDQPTIVKIGWPRDARLCTAIARVRWVQFEPDRSSGEGLYRVGLSFETWDVRRLKEIVRQTGLAEAERFRLVDSW